MAEYDFIVVGTGAGGSVMANRLTENPDVSVLALEAGGAEVPEIVHNAPDWWKIWGTEWDWNYKSTPQEACNGRQTDEHRGKLLGGSSDLYIMMHIRGHCSDFDGWAADGWTRVLDTGSTTIRQDRWHVLIDEIDAGADTGAAR